MTDIRVTRTSQVVWLNLAEGVQVSIPLDEALELDRRGFAKLYRRHVITATRHEARKWADQQIALRDSITRAEAASR